MIKCCLTAQLQTPECLTEEFICVVKYIRVLKSKFQMNLETVMKKMTQPQKYANFEK